ncbi:MAG TPA: polyphosphate kinase 2 family protein [Roseiflexaceae bacterium]|nr:polyphosphate kinase 2 family protein [Roseiflexaceae bacterium]
MTAKKRNKTSSSSAYPRHRIEPGQHVKLSDIDPDDTGGYRDKAEVATLLEEQRVRIDGLQERLYAEHKQALLIVLQAMDTGGKDGTISHVFEGVNPQGCQVWPFKVPTPEELDHDFLWRHHTKTPGRGMMTIFNRSHYENVLVVRVHQLVPEQIWKARYDQINDFEQLLAANNTTILKFFLHISKDEQKRRLESRLQNPDKRWKFAIGDLKERELWDDYMKAYEDAINKCSTNYAPWYVLPANKKWYRNLVVARTIADTLESMNPQFPQPEEGLENVTIPD